MIGWLKGRIESIKPTELILDVNGVGYLLTIPFTTYSQIKDLENTSLYVTTYVREDQLKLFGFHTVSEKKFFEILIRISGVGPSMAVSILSGMSVAELVSFVKEGNIQALTTIPGIGKTKAEKLIFELKRKLKSFENAENGNEKVLSNDADEAVEALITLGFDGKKISSMVNEIIKKEGSLPVEEIIKKVLKSFQV